MASTRHFITGEECAVRYKSVEDKLDLLLEFHKRYWDEQAKRNGEFENGLADYNKTKNKVIGGGVVASAIISVLIGLLRWVK